MANGKRFMKMILLMTLLMGMFSLSIMLFSKAREDNNTYIVINPNTMELVQLKKPQEGDPIAVIDTTLGEVRIRLYPEYSPDAVKNFTELAEKGYYDNTYIFDAQDGAYSGCGSAEKNGSTGKDSNERVKRELNQDLWPFRGAVCMLNTEYERSFKEKIFGGGTYYCGSRFLLINSIQFTDEVASELREASTSETLAEAFIEKGGLPNLSQQMTIIGQTYEGFDVVDALASLESEKTGSYKTPKEDVMINSITIGTYSSSEEEK